MSMTKEALEFLQASLAAAGVKGLPVHLHLVPENMRLESSERFEAAPVRQRRSFVTNRLDDFLAYTLEHSDGRNSAVLVAPDMAHVHGVLNHGTNEAPGWGDHTSKLELKFTPEFQALKDVCDKGLAQQVVIELLEDWGKTHLSALDEDGRVINVATAIGSIRKITINAKSTATAEQGDMRASRSTFEEVEAKAQEGSLPAFIEFNGHVYHGLQSRTLRARVSVITGSDKPVLKLRLVEWDFHLSRMAEEVEQRCKESLPEVPVYVGNSRMAG